MYKILFIVIVALVISCSKHPSEEVCKFGEELYLSALTNELVKEGVKIIRSDNEKVCYSKKMWLEGDRASARTEHYYRGAATLSSTEDQADRVRNWLENKGREYSESRTDSGKYFFVVYSGSKEEFKETQNELEALYSEEECE